jgi:hypothetical protein
MAIYEGARPRSTFLPVRLPHAAVADAPALPRRRMRGAVRANRRSNRIALLLGGIVLAFLLAFFSLAQTVRVSATGYDIDRLSRRALELDRSSREILSDLNRLGASPAIRKQAIDLGLAPLGEPLTLPAR